MANSINKAEFIKRLATHASTDEHTAGQWIDSVTDTLYETFQGGNGVTLQGFGGFYLDKRKDGYAFKFNPGQKLRALFGWSSSYKKSP